jgi:hypothetical protein
MKGNKKGGRPIEGGDGDDVLIGTKKNDTISGHAGDDDITGGLGIDIMSGGEGADTFYFETDDTGDYFQGGADVIVDLEETDIIDIVGLGVTFWSARDPDPPRGTFTIRDLGDSALISWNLNGSLHDIEIKNFDGDIDRLYDQVRWYEDDYRASTATDGVVAVGQNAQGEIENESDVDWFRIELEAGNLYRIDVQGEADGGGTAVGPYVELVDEFGNYMAFGYEELSYVPEFDGTYFAVVGFIVGTYTLEVTSAPYVDDFGGDINTNGLIAVGETLVGEIGAPDDEDWFKITLDAGDEITIDLRGQSSGAGTLFDPWLLLLDAEGGYITGNDDAGSLDSQIVFEAVADGDYFIVARDFYGMDMGTYELSVA